MYVALRQIKIQTPTGIEVRRRGDKVSMAEVNNNPDALLRMNYICHEADAQDRLSGEKGPLPVVPVDANGEPIADLESYKAQKKKVRKRSAHKVATPGASLTAAVASEEVVAEDRIDLGSGEDMLKRVKEGSDEKMKPRQRKKAE